MIKHSISILLAIALVCSLTPVINDLQTEPAQPTLRAELAPVVSETTALPVLMDEDMLQHLARKIELRPRNYLCSACAGFEAYNIFVDPLEEPERFQELLERSAERGRETCLNKDCKMSPSVVLDQSNGIHTDSKDIYATVSQIAAMLRLGDEDTVSYIADKFAQQPYYYFCPACTGAEIKTTYTDPSVDPEQLQALRELRVEHESLLCLSNDCKMTPDYYND